MLRALCPELMNVAEYLRLFVAADTRRSRCRSWRDDLFTEVRLSPPAGRFWNRSDSQNYTSDAETQKQQLITAQVQKISPSLTLSRLFNASFMEI